MHSAPECVKLIEISVFRRAISLLYNVRKPLYALLSSAENWPKKDFCRLYRTLNLWNWVTCIQLMCYSSRSSEVWNALAESIHSLQLPPSLKNEKTPFEELMWNDRYFREAKSDDAGRNCSRCPAETYHVCPPTYTVAVKGQRQNCLGESSQTNKQIRCPNWSTWVWTVGDINTQEETVNRKSRAETHAHNLLSVRYQDSPLSHHHATQLIWNHPLLPIIILSAVYHHIKINFTSMQLIEKIKGILCL